MTEYLCNLVIPGAAKSGTSSLFSALVSHPEIAEAFPKEPQFFSSDERFSGGAAAHNAYFGSPPPKAEYYCDASQSYFLDAGAIERIKASLDNPKVIIMLRDPIARIQSHYRWAVRSGMEKSSLADAIEDRGDRTDYFLLERSDAYWPVGGYLAFSRYSRYLPMWRESFPPEDILVLKSERYFANPFDVLDEVYTFLGLQPHQEEEIEHRNSSVGTRLRHPPEILSSLASLMPAGLRRNVVYRDIKDRVLRSLSPDAPSQIEDSLRAKLEIQLAADIALHRSL